MIERKSGFLSDLEAGLPKKSWRLAVIMVQGSSAIAKLPWVELVYFERRSMSSRVGVHVLGNRGLGMNPNEFPTFLEWRCRSRSATEAPWKLDNLRVNCSTSISRRALLMRRWRPSRVESVIFSAICCTTFSKIWLISLSLSPFSPGEKHTDSNTP